MNKPTYIYMPKTNLMGVGCLKNMGKELASGGYKRALVVTDPNLVKVGHVAKVEQILKEQNIAYTVFDGVERPNPNIATVENGLKHLQKMLPDCDLVISIGGGTNHDAARSIALLASNGGAIVDYEGLNRLAKPILTWVAVNTLGGSGAHVTMVDVIVDDGRKTKIALSDPKMMAAFSVDDPALHVTAPKEASTSAGIDVLAHGVEAYFSSNATPYTDTLALGAVKLVFTNLKKVIISGNDLESRANLAEAAAMAGTAFNNAGLGYTHAIAHQIGGETYRHHGLICGSLLPYVLKFNAPAVPVQRLTYLANAMGETQGTDRNSLEAVLSALKKLYADIAIPADISEMGAKKGSVPEYAEKAIKDIVALTNPRKATLEELEQLIKEAMGDGRDPSKAEREVVLAHS